MIAPVSLVRLVADGEVVDAEGIEDVERGERGAVVGHVVVVAELLEEAELVDRQVELASDRNSSSETIFAQLEQIRDQASREGWLDELEMEAAVLRNSYIAGH